jgi:hypothetical protein
MHANKGAKTNRRTTAGIVSSIDAFYVGKLNQKFALVKPSKGEATNRVCPQKELGAVC